MHEIQRFVDSIPPPDPGLRARVMASLPPEDRQPQPRWASAVAVVLAVVVVGTLVFGLRGLSLRAQPAGGRAVPSPAATSGPVATPTVAPAPPAVSRPLDVPDSTPVIAFRQGGGVAGVAWSGGEPGLTAVQSDPHGLFAASPDGSRFLVTSGGRFSVYDRQGTLVGDLAIGQKGESAFWADDDRHLCSLRFDGTGEHGPTTLRLVQPGGPARDVAQVGQINGQSLSSVLACGVQSDQAVVEQSLMGLASELWVVRLSTGTVLAHYTYPGNARSFVVASHDGTLLAETIVPCCPAGTPTARIRRADGEAVAELRGQQVVGFSWDRTLAVTGIATPPRVVDWLTGRVLWTAPVGTVLQSMLAEPGGYRVAVWVAPPATVAPQGPADLWIVSPDGTASRAVQRLAGSP